MVRQLLGARGLNTISYSKPNLLKWKTHIKCFFIAMFTVATRGHCLAINVTSRSATQEGSDYWFEWKWTNRHENIGLTWGGGTQTKLKLSAKTASSPLYLLINSDLPVHQVCCPQVAESENTYNCINALTFWNFFVDAEIWIFMTIFGVYCPFCLM